MRCDTQRPAARLARMRLRLLLPPLLSLFVLPACTIMGHEKVQGWPELEIVEHRVPVVEMRERCSKYVGPGTVAEACAEFDLQNRRCHIWFASDFPPSKAIVEHERLHCAGYDHIGDDNMRTILARFRARERLAERPIASGASAGASTR